MGFFDEVKKAASGAKEGIGNARQGWSDMVDQQNEQQEAARLAHASTSIIDPTPQDEIDRINAGDGPGRAVVTGNANNLESGENVFRTNATIYVRMRLAGGELGPEAKLKIWTSSGVIRSLVAGTEIPAIYDRATGTPTELDQKAIAAELKDRKKGGGGGGF